MCWSYLWGAQNCISRHEAPVLASWADFVQQPYYFQFPDISWQLQRLCTLHEEQENVIQTECCSYYAITQRQYCRLFDTVSGIGD
jgi:hypothetical protein